MGFSLRCFYMGLGACVAISFGMVGGNDYEDALKDQARYCGNVEKGLWPDYQENFKDICKKDVDS